jgi:uncharacterized protein with HEPN domain
VSPLDRAVLAERTQAINRHLERVAEKLPPTPEGLQSSRDASVRAAGFRNVVAHAYETLDLARVHQAATKGPADLLAFVGILGRLV